MSNGRKDCCARVEAELLIARSDNLFEGEDRGVNLILNLNIVVDQEGVYWFNVLLEDQFVTRIPLRIFYQRIGQSM
jgi:hypothetical protein